MSFTQDFRTQRRNYSDGETRIGEKDRLWYDSNTNSIRISDGVTPGGVIVGGSGGGGDYILPTASALVKGGVKIGSNITITDGVISVAAPFSGSYNDLTNKPDIPSLTGYATETYVTTRGYLTSYTETDPVFAASDAAGITSTDISNWGTAYGWGNHADAGYLTSVGTITTLQWTASEFFPSAPATSTVTAGDGTVDINLETGIPGSTTSVNWAFTNQGTIEFPDGTTQTSAYTGDSSTTEALTIGTGLSGTSFNGSTAVTIALDDNYGDTKNPYASKTAKYFLAAPNAANGTPTFRAIVASDIPTLNQNTTGSAATLTTARSINGVSFNGSADITVTAAAGTLTGTTLASGVTASSLTSVGTLLNLSVTNTITGSVSGNAGTATKLATARAINGIDFDGSADITVAAAAGTLTGNTLASGVTSSSLTSVGTLTGLTVTSTSSSSSNVVSITGVTSPANGSTATWNFQTEGTSIGSYGSRIRFPDSTYQYTAWTGTAAAGTLTGTTLNSTVVTSSLTSVGTLTGLAVTTTTTGNAVNVTYNPASANGAAYFATGKDTAGGTGYFDFLRATNTTSGVTNATKTFRVNSTGTLQILNSAYNATIFSVTDAGFIAINASTGTTNGVPVNNAIEMNTNSYIYDDGNYHLTAKTGNIWLNSNNGGAVSINQQVPSGTTAGGLAVTGPVNAQTGYYARTAWNSAIDTEITVDDYRFRISNSGGIFPQVISNTSSTKNSAWTVVAARSGSAITQTGSTGTLVPNNSWTSLYTSGGMDSAGDTFVCTLQDKNEGRIYRVTFMRSDNGSTTGYNIIAERLL